MVLALGKILWVWHWNPIGPSCGYNFFTWCASLFAKFTSSSQKLRSKKKVHVWGTIARIPFSFAKNGFGILFREYLGLFNENTFFVSYPLVLRKITVLWHPNVKIFTSRHFSWKRMNNFIYKKYILSENMFLKTYKKKYSNRIDRFFKKDQTVRQNDSSSLTQVWKRLT